METNNKVFKSIASTIAEVIYKSSINSQKEIDSKFKKQLSHSIYLLAQIYTLLKLVADHPKQTEITDELFESQMIIWQACNTMFAALQLIRQGYMLEPQFLMRQAVESLALSLSFHADHKSYSLYKAGKLSGEKCITSAKVIIKEIGQIYGLLSSVTHPSNKTTGSHYDEESKTLIIGGGYTKKLSYRTIFNFSMLNHLLLTIWKGSELIFYKFEKNPKMWEKNENTYNLKLDSTIKSIVKDVMLDFKLAISDLD